MKTWPAELEMEEHLKVSVLKEDGAFLAEVEFLNIELLGNGADTPLIEAPEPCVFEYLWEHPSRCHVSLPISVEAYGPLPLSIRATLRAEDMAGNKESALLTGTLTL